MELDSNAVPIRTGILQTLVAKVKFIWVTGSGTVRCLHAASKPNRLLCSPHFFPTPLQVGCYGDAPGVAGDSVSRNPISLLRCVEGISSQTLREGFLTGNPNNRNIPVSEKLSRNAERTHTILIRPVIHGG